MVNKYIYVMLGLIVFGVLGISTSGIFDVGIYKGIFPLIFMLGMLMLLVPVIVGVYFEIKENKGID